MTADAQLGYPLEFDLYGFWFSIEKGATRGDVNRFYNGGVFNWFFGRMFCPLVSDHDAVSLS
jgi:hypothetical protein